MKRASLLLGLLLVIVFLPFALGGKTLLSSARDVSSVLPQGAVGDSPGPNFLKEPDAGAPAWLTEPSFAIIHRALVHEHALPAWNPYSAFGAPLAGDLQTQPYYPLSFAYALVPSPVTYNWWVLLRLFVAGIGMFAFLRWHVSFFPAVMGAITTMLSGYYIIHYDMPHLSVEVLLPALLFCVEYALRKPGPRSLALTFVVAFSAVTGGMPESTLLVMLFAVAYAIFAVLLRRAGGAPLATGSVTLVAGLGLGIAASSIALLPFIEFWRVSFNIHDSATGAAQAPGPAADAFGAAVGQYIAPLMLGPTRNNIFTGFAGFTGMRGYFGASIAFFGLVALIDLVARRFARVAARTDAPLIFFALATVLILAKRYGLPFINWIGYLPGLRYVIFPQYEEALLVVSVAACAAIGLERLLSGRLPAWCAMGSAAVWLAAITSIEMTLAPDLAHATQPEYFAWALGLALLALAASALIALVPRVSPAWPRERFLGPAAAVIVAIELSCNYIVPTFYARNPEPSASTDPYAGAPFVSYLQGVAAPGRWRVFGKDGYLFPSWAGAFGLADITQLDALYFNRYLPWVRAFLLVPGVAPAELSDRYTGTSSNTFGTPLERRFLQLASVRFVVANTMPTGANALYETAKTELSAAPEFKAAQGVAQRMQVGSATDDGFLVQPPFDRLAVTLTVPDDATKLVFQVGTVPSQTAKCDAAIGLRTTMSEGARTVVQQSLRLTKPGWQTQRFDVSAERGHTATLVLAAKAPGTCSPALGIAALHYEPVASAASSAATFRRLAVADAPVYELTPVVSRAMLYYGIDGVASGDAALHAVAAPAFDIFARAAVELDATAPNAALTALAHAAPAKAEPATVTRYESSRVEIDAHPARPALLMLNDVNYPGWAATVDGAPAPIVATDYLFRGVVLAPGAHTVVFTYDPPSLRAGVAIALGATALTVMLALGWWQLRRRRASAAERNDDGAPSTSSG